MRRHARPVHVPALSTFLEPVQQSGEPVFHKLVHDELGRNHGTELDAEVIYVLLDERDVEEGEVRVEGLDDEELHDQRVGVLDLPSVVLPPREHPREHLIDDVEDGQDHAGDDAAEHFVLKVIPRVVVRIARVAESLVAVVEGQLEDQVLQRAADCHRDEHDQAREQELKSPSVRGVVRLQRELDPIDFDEFVQLRRAGNLTGGVAGSKPTALAPELGPRPVHLVNLRALPEALQLAGLIRPRLRVHPRPQEHEQHVVQDQSDLQAVDELQRGEHDRGEDDDALPAGEHREKREIKRNLRAEVRLHAIKVPHVFSRPVLGRRGPQIIAQLTERHRQVPVDPPVHHRAPAPVVVVVKEENAVVEQVFANLLRVLGHLAQLPQHERLRRGRIEHPRLGVLLELGRLAGAETHHATVGSLHEKLSLVRQRYEHLPRCVHRDQNLAPHVPLRRIIRRIRRRLRLVGAGGQLQDPRGEVVVAE